MNKRYYVNDNTTIDLEEVSAIVVRGWSYTPSTGEKGYRYTVALKSGQKIECIGEFLRKQYNEYKGITRNESVEGE